uniref:Uncharacterized protein n=1 Tax=Panagrellus redivivus TaxID=6233 RepID=A0A7E4V0S1_PANRE
MRGQAFLTLLKSTQIRTPPSRGGIERAGDSGEMARARFKNAHRARTLGLIAWRYPIRESYQYIMPGKAKIYAEYDYTSMKDQRMKQSNREWRQID